MNTAQYFSLVCYEFFKHLDLYVQFVNSKQLLFNSNSITLIHTGANKYKITSNPEINSNVLLNITVNPNSVNNIKNNVLEHFKDFNNDIFTSSLPEIEIIQQIINIIKSQS